MENPGITKLHSLLKTQPRTGKPYNFLNWQPWTTASHPFWGLMYMESPQWCLTSGGAHGIELPVFKLCVVGNWSLVAQTRDKYKMEKDKGSYMDNKVRFPFFDIKILF